MQMKTRQELTKRIRGYLRDGTTALSDSETTHPTSGYICPDHLRLERDTLFRDNPILVGLSCQLQNPGDFLTDSYSGTPLLIVRQKNQSLSGFVNACRHRGAPIASGSGTCKGRLVCPFHAWSFGLNGDLLNVPGEEGFSGLDQKEKGLIPISVIEKNGLIWAIPNPELASHKIEIEEFLGGLEEEIKSFGFDNYHHLETRVIHPNMNWKIAVEGFLESYHLGPLHKTTVGPFYYTNVGTSDVYGLHHRLVGVRRSISEVDDESEIEEDFLLHTIVIYTLAPNTILIYQRDHVEIWRMFPDKQDPGKCTIVFSFYIPEPAENEKAQRYWNTNFKIAHDTVVDEDLVLSEQIQKSFESRTLKSVVFGRNEPALSCFHASLRAMTTGFSYEQ